MQRKLGRSGHKKFIKLTLLAICGCLAYFAGNYYGQKKMIDQVPAKQVSK